jgi:hypothetical protein
MKKLWIIFLVGAILLSCASQFRQEMRTQDTIKDLKRDVIKEVVISRQQYRRVWCCCQTMNGICCNWTIICPGYIPGCLCQ